MAFRAIPWTPAVAILTAILGSGCATTATIHRAAAPGLDAAIVDSDAEAVYVTSDSGRLFRIPRREIASIDHPGNVVALVGALLLAVGATAFLAASDYNDDEARTVALVYGVPGGAMLVTGLFPWLRSRNAVGHFGQPQRVDAPTVLPADQVVTCPPGSSAPGQVPTTPTPTIRLRPVPPASAPAAPQPAAPASKPGQPPTAVPPPASPPP